jgi:hypothetical protein
MMALVYVRPDPDVEEGVFEVWIGVAEQGWIIMAGRESTWVSKSTLHSSTYSSQNF